MPIDHIGRLVVSELFKKELEKELKTFKPWDLIFLVHQGPQKLPWLWSFGNDGRVTNQPAISDTQSLQPMNGRSTNEEDVIFPKEHTRTMFGNQFSNIVFNRDGNMVATFNDAGLQIWLLGQSKPVNRMVFQSGRYAFQARFSPSDRLLLVSFTDDTLEMIETATLTEFARLSLPHDTTSFVINEDETRIVTLANWRPRLWVVEPTAQDLVRRARQLSPRCLTAEERSQLLLDVSPAALVHNGPWTRSGEESCQMATQNGHMTCASSATDFWPLDPFPDENAFAGATGLNTRGAISLAPHRIGVTFGTPKSSSSRYG